MKKMVTVSFFLDSDLTDEQIKKLILYNWNLEDPDQDFLWDDDDDTRYPVTYTDFIVDVNA